MSARWTARPSCGTRERETQHPHPADRRDDVPHGGLQHCGYGKDLSMYGFGDYTQIEHVMSALS